MADQPSGWHRDTIAVAAGRDRSPGAGLNVPPTFASTYQDGGAVGYGRHGNPSWQALEDAIGELEGGVAVGFGSGMAAVAAVIEGLPAGAKVLVPADCYAGTRILLDDLAARNRLVVERVDPGDPAGLEQSLAGADLLWVETPTNPLLRVVDLPAVCALASTRGVRVVVDNTFATPFLQRPLESGASAVVHSATKYIGGHSDLLLGLVVARDEPGAEELRTRRTLHGGVPGVMEAFLALRGLRTLPLRIERAQANALTLAERLVEHPGVRRVHYPGLPDDPGHALATRLMDGFGAMLSVDLGTAERADAVLGRLRLISGTTSLGGVDTTAERRSRQPGEDHLPPGLVRISVGVEHVEDLWADLGDSLAAES